MCRCDGNYRCGSGLKGHTGARSVGDLSPLRRTLGLQAPPGLEGHVGPTAAPSDSALSLLTDVSLGTRMTQF